MRGELPRGPTVAIVGTRHPTAEGAAFATSLASQLASGGVAVISGGAVGIDSAAHRGAMEAGAVTTVIAPAGFLRPFPEDNAPLFEEIVTNGGAYASLVEDHVAATQAAFFARNACLAALSWVLVVVEAGFRSGARNAAKHARRLGRPLFVVPSAPWSPKGAGCIEELRRGAHVCASARDVFDALAEVGARLIPPSAKPGGGATRDQPEQLSWFDEQGTAGPLRGGTPLPPINEGATGDLEERVVRAVAAGAEEADAVAELAGLSVAVVNRILLTLRLQGVLVSAAPGHIALRKSSD